MAATPQAPTSVVIAQASGPIPKDACQALIDGPANYLKAHPGDEAATLNGATLTANMRQIAAKTTSDSEFCRWTTTTSTLRPARPTALARFFGARATMACTQDPADYPWVCGGYRHDQLCLGPPFCDVWDDIDYFGMWNDDCVNGDHLYHQEGAWPGFWHGTNSSGWDPQYGCPNNGVSASFWYADPNTPWWHFDWFHRLRVFKFNGATVARGCVGGDWSCINAYP